MSEQTVIGVASSIQYVVDYKNDQYEHGGPSSNDDLNVDTSCNPVQMVSSLPVEKEGMPRQVFNHC